MASCFELLLHERAQAAEGGEGRPADLIVGNDEAKALLERRDDVHDGHGIELGERTEERRGRIEGFKPPAQLQRRAHHCDHLFDQQLSCLLNAWGICGYKRCAWRATRSALRIQLNWPALIVARASSPRRARKAGEATSAASASPNAPVSAGEKRSAFFPCVRTSSRFGWRGATIAQPAARYSKSLSGEA